MSKRTASAGQAFRRGFISAFDIGLRTRSVATNARKPSPDADGTAIAADWRRVGNDLHKAAAQQAAFEWQRRVGTDSLSTAVAPCPQHDQRPSVARIQATHTTYSGPIPPADALAAYAQIDPQLVHRIVQMAELEQTHRHSQDDETSRFMHRWMSLGQGLGAALGATALGVAAYAVAHHEPWVAGTAITSVAGLVGAFFWRERVEQSAGD